MSTRLVLSTLLLTLTATPAAAAGDADGIPTVCGGTEIARLDRVLPDDTRRFRLAAEMVAPVSRLFAANARVRPDNITVYALPGLPLVLALQRAGCVVGLMQMTRSEFYRALDQRLGPTV